LECCCNGGELGVGLLVDLGVAVMEDGAFELLMMIRLNLRKGTQLWQIKRDAGWIFRIRAIYRSPVIATVWVN